MLHYYTYEYGRVEADEAVHVYRNKDGLIGLRVFHQRRDGVWSEGYSRFFIWADDGSSIDFEREWQARASLGAADDAATVSSSRPPDAPERRTSPR